MTIKYQENIFRSNAESSRFILPGDDEMAEINGFEKRTSRLSFIDDRAFELAQLVAQKGWNIPGIDVEFWVGGTDDKPVHRIWRLKGTLPGRRWEIGFSRDGYEFEDKCVNTTPQHVEFPGYDMDIYSDGSGSCCRYVGDNWEADEEDFVNSSKIHSKMDKKPRTYLKYDLRGTTFVHTNDCGREYEPEGDEPESFETWEVLAAADQFFGGVIDSLKRMPDAPKGAYQSWIDLAKIDLVPAPENMPTLFVTKRVYSGETEGKVILSGSGKRLVSLDRAYNKKFPVPEIATEGFDYGFALPPYTSRAWGDDPYWHENRIYKVDLKYANDIFVIDEKPFMDCWGYHSDVMEDEDRVLLTQDEVDERYQVAAKTLVPLAEYKGDYAQPIYLIHRPLWADEAIDVTRDIRKTLPPLDVWDKVDEEYERRFMEAMQAKRNAENAAVYKPMPHYLQKLKNG